ncbi:MAG: F0F1 ATP synthase subunit delta, partial [Mycobacteriales bacterium]
MQGASRDALATARDRLTTLLQELSDPAARSELADQLFGVVTLLDAQGALRRALSDPALPAGHKTELADSLFGRQLTADGLELVRTVARGAWSRPIDLVDALELLAVEVVLASAETADELDDIDDELFRFTRIL